jgi:hypothetical protein
VKRVYFIRPVGQEGPVKIGCSEWPFKRLDTLMSWSPVPLEVAVDVPGCMKLEKRFHSMFVSDWMHREWFKGSPRLTAVIDRLKAGENPERVAQHEGAPVDLRRRSIYQNPSWRRWRSYEARMMSRFGYGGTPVRAREVLHAWRESVPDMPDQAAIAYLDDVLSRRRSKKEAA